MTGETSSATKKKVTYKTKLVGILVCCTDLTELENKKEECKTFYPMSLLYKFKDFQSFELFVFLFKHIRGHSSFVRTFM